MTRVLSLIVVGGLALILFSMSVDRSTRLAALGVGEELYWKDESRAPELLEFLLASAAAPDAAGAPAVLRLGSVTIGAEGTPDPEGQRLLRRSVARALRSAVAGGMPLPEGPEGPAAYLEVRGETEAVPGGVELTLIEAGGQLSLTARREGESVTHLTALEGKHKWKEPNKGSLIPPLVAIALAVVLRRPIIALFLGVLVGAGLVRYADGDGPFGSATGALLDVPVRWFGTELLEPERAMIIAFVVFMLAMVGLITRTGGIRGLMDSISGWANSAKSTQVATYCMGLVIFFDDYANTILVGATMRPLTDRFRVAREKLAYLVDSTAAPVAGISVLSTWIAFEVSTFSAQLPAAGLEPSDGYAIFIQSLPYRFYCILTLVFVGTLVWTERDFGPMRKAVKRARDTGQLIRPGGKPMISEKATALEPAAGVKPHAWTALVPLGVFLFVVLEEILRVGGAGGLFQDGELFTIEGLTSVLFEGSGSRPLMIGALAGFLVSAAIAAGQGLARDIPMAAWTTLRSMGVAVVILYLAWMIGSVCTELGTADFLTVQLSDRLEPLLLPALLFLLSRVVAFATGSSWSTMTILLPLVVGLAFNLGETTALGGMTLLLLSIGAVLEGAIFGDHCSPISDTTVLSSVACASDHIDHVRTQAPYALVTMVTAMVAGYLPCAFLGWSPWLGLAVGAAVIVGLVFLLGRVPEPLPATEPEPEPAADLA